MAGGNVPWIRSAIPYPDYRFHHWRRRIASSRIMLGVIAIELYNLREVGLPCEYVLNSALVEVESICTKLEAVPARRSWIVSKNLLVVLRSRLPTVNAGISLVSGSIATNTHASPISS